MENFGKVKIMGKVQTSSSYKGSTAYAVRSSFGESKTQDIIQYFVRYTAQDTRQQYLQKKRQISHTP